MKGAVVQKLKSILEVAKRSAFCKVALAYESITVGVIPGPRR